MLDQNLFINDYEETKRRLTRKRVPVEQIEEITIDPSGRMADINQDDNVYLNDID